MIGRLRRMLIGLAVAAFAAACTVGPNYKRPAVDVPTRLRGQPEPVVADVSSFGEQPWWEVFQDSELQSMIRTALAENYDVRLAASRVMAAEAQLGITRADQYPSATAGVAALGQRNSAAVGSVRTIAGVEVQGTAAWQLDFWGRYRRATEAARAELLATTWGQRAVVTTLLSQLADAYFGLRALDLELDISKRTLDSRRQSLDLTRVREQGGATSLLDVRQAEQLVYGAAAVIVELERRIEQEENFISILLGGNPSPVRRGAALVDQPHPPAVPPGLPSSLLERRPDIQQSEQVLVAANARIGVARAAYFPQINLTGAAGFESTSLSALFAGSNVFWSATAALAQPIFTAGRTRSQVALTEALQQQALLSYQQTIKQAFRDVSDSLVGYRKAREFREQQALLLAAAQDAQRLTDIRYQGGASSYLEVLDAQTRLFVAELGLAEAQLNELSTFVSLYRALGGGWQSS